MRHSILIIDADADYYRRQLLEAAFNVEINAVTSADKADDFLPRATVICGLSPVFNDDLIRAAPGLQWIQALTSGTDTITTCPSLPAEITVTSMRGIHGPQMSELAIMQMISLARNYRQLLENQASATWKRWAQPILMGKTAGILGIGEIGRALAARLKALEMTVVGFSGVSGRDEAHFDRIENRSRLVELTPSLDYLIVLVPLSARTERLVDVRVLNAMRRDAYLINLARGGVVDEEALLAVLEREQIAGAALDVFIEEPLPKSNRFWNLRNVLITPHIGGNSTTYAQQAAPLLVRNASLFLTGSRGSNLSNCVLHRSAY